MSSYILSRKLDTLLLSMLATGMGLASCGGSGPTSPTPRPPTVWQLTPGTYGLLLISSHCSGGPPDLPVPAAALMGLDLQLQADGSDWVGRPQAPDVGNFQLRLRVNDDTGPVVGTMRGHADHYITYDSSVESVDVSEPATLTGRRFLEPSPAILGIATGEMGFNDRLLGPVTCTSASWLVQPKSSS